MEFALTDPGMTASYLMFLPHTIVIGFGHATTTIVTSVGTGGPTPFHPHASYG
jgi:hypothetical protein